MTQSILRLLLKSVIFVLIATLTAFVAVPLLILNVSNNFLVFQISPLNYVGLLPMVIGTSFVLWTVFSFVLIGRGTPAPFDAPKKLVVVGLFKYVRNPLYLGAILVLFGEAIIFESGILFLFAAAMWIFFHCFVVYYEEPSLKKRFGQEYDDYKTRVPRWIPTLKKKYEKLSHNKSA